MIKGQVRAVRAVRMEAERLRLACVEAAGGKALLHIAFDREADSAMPVSDQIAIAQLGAIK